MGCSFLLRKSFGDQVEDMASLLLELGSLDAEQPANEERDACAFASSDQETLLFQRTRLRLSAMQHLKEIWLVLFIYSLVTWKLCVH